MTALMMKHRYLVIKENEPNFIFISDIDIEKDWKYFYIEITEEQYQYLKSIGTAYREYEE
jgi:hypothetical protein